MKRKIINIDADKCTGCGICVPDCPEGALQIIDGKARLISDLFCDGLGACIKTCPENAFFIEEREAEAYDEKTVMGNIVKHGENTIKAHLKHLKDHGEEKFLKQAIDYLNENKISIPDFEEKTTMACGCPSSVAQDLRLKKHNSPQNDETVNAKTELAQWPVQLKLLNPNAPYFDNADLLVSADCVPFAYGNFHAKFLKGKIVIMFCPKLDPDIDGYIEKLSLILKNHPIKSITIARMEVPCCGGVNHVVEKALEKSGKNIFVKEYIVSINGEIL
jgi:NAD-dependent dihydropyrimidine dehydrogenase PreA subunit